jgi:malate permease and related proteins
MHEASIAPGAVISAILPVAIAILAGFVWSRTKGGLDPQAITPVVVEIGTPCLVVSTLVKAVVTPEAVATIALATAAAIACFAVVGGAALMAFGLRLRTYLPSVAFPNSGNLGLPLALYAYGEQGLGYAIVFFAISSIANHSLGQALSAGMADWRGLVRMPVLYAIAVGLAAAYFHAAPPVWLSRTLDLMGGLTVPLMLLMLGGSLAKLRVNALRRALGVSALRICAGTIVGVGVAAAFGLEGAARAVLILQCSMPVAVYNYLYAQRWSREPEEVAGLVFVSTAASAVTIPVLLMWLPGAGAA